MKLVAVIFIVPLAIIPALARIKNMAGLHQPYGEFQTNIRQKRGTVVLLSRHIRARDGKNAVKTILQGAREISASTNTKYFQKRGTFANAVREFKSLKPEDIMRREDNSLTDTFVIDGIVGDRLIEVKTRGYRGLPTVEIKQMGLKRNYPFYMNYVIQYVN